MTEAATNSPGLLTGTANGYRNRLASVQERIDAYHPDCQRRAATDACQAGGYCLGNVHSWITGDYDGSYAGPIAGLYDSEEGFRLYYAGDSLTGALHYLVWAEYYAGLTDRDSANSADPWRAGSQPPGGLNHD